MMLLTEFITVVLSVTCVLLLGAPIALWQVKSFSPTMIRVSLWYGLAILVVITVVTNLFIPLRSLGAVAIVLAVIGLAVLATVLIRSRTNLVTPKLSWKPLRGLNLLIIVVMAVVLGWMLIASNRAPTNYDSGLYHIQSIWYAANYQAIPGLANLYPSYGFSNSLNTIAAWISNGPMGLESYRVINSIFFLLLFIEIALRLVSDRRNSVGTKILLASLAVFVAPMIVMVDYWVTSPTFDTAVAILVFISTAAIADSLTARRVTSADFTIALLTVSIAASMRQHYWFLFAFTAGTLLWVVYRRGGGRERLLFWIAIVFSFIIFVVMICRDYILSGWVMYPYKTVAFNLDWIAPDPSALISSTKLWARSPTPLYQQAGEGWGWIRPWLGANLTSWVFIGILGALLVALMLCVISRKLWRPRSLMALVIPQLLFLATWFFAGAPHVRYVWAPLLLLGVLPLAWAWRSLGTQGKLPETLSRIAVLAISAELVAVVAYASLVVWPRLAADLPDIQVETVTLNSTISLLIPQGTDQCWDNFPVCSAMPAEGLAPRGNEISDGFIHQH
jgi:hypothetical protein